MAETQQAENRMESGQTSSEERKARQSGNVPRTFNFADRKGIVGIFIWFLIVILIFGLIYLLS